MENVTFPENIVQAAERKYQQAVEQYLSLVADSGSFGTTARVKELEAAKQAVEICREQYRSLQQSPLVVMN